MPDFEKENEELKKRLSILEEINSTLKSRNGIEEDLLDTIRTNTNIIRDHSKAITFQIQEKEKLKKTSKDIANIAERGYTLMQEELGTEKTKKTLLKDRESLAKNIISLQSLQNKKLVEDVDQQKSIDAEIQNQIKSAKKLQKELNNIEETSEEIRGNFGVKSFSGLSDITKSIPGLRKFSGPFEKAAEAARKQAASNKLAHGSVKGMGKAISPMKAGFKALGGTIMKAMGPLAIAKVLIDIGKFFLDAMFEASKQTSQISRDLGVSKEFAGETLTAINQMGLAMKEMGDGPYINAAAFLETQGKINEALGLSLNLATGYGDEVTNNTFKVSQLNKKIGLDAQQSQRLISDNLKTEGDLTEEITGRLTLLMLEEGFHVGTKDILKETLSITGTLRANFRGNAGALAEAVYQAKVLGFNLKDMEGIQSNLLSFQTSIEAEMEAELLTGRQLNLEKARTLALDNDLVGVATELNKQNITYSNFSEMNVFARQATAKALGMEANQMADILQKQEDINKLKNLAKQTEFESLKIVDENNELQAKGKEAILKLLRQEGTQRTDIIKKLGKDTAQRLLNQDAQEKFNDALDKAKGIFTQFVTGGTLDDLASGLEKMTNSFWFKTLIGDPKGERENREKNTPILTTLDSNLSSKNLDIGSSSILQNLEKEIKSGESFSSKELYNTIHSGLMDLYKTNKLSRKEVDKLNPFTTEAFSNDYTLKNTPTDKLEDFILRPGQKPLKYRKDDIIIGGTNLDGGKGNSRTEQLLERLIMAVEQGQNISVDGNRLNTAVAMNTSKFGA